MERLGRMKPQLSSEILKRVPARKLEARSWQLSQSRGACSWLQAAASVSQWGMRFLVRARVTVWVYSCRRTRAQSKFPIESPAPPPSPVSSSPEAARGTSMAMTFPVQAPTVPIQGRPVVRTPNCSWEGNISIWVGAGSSWIWK